MPRRPRRVDAGSLNDNGPSFLHGVSLRADTPSDRFPFELEVVGQVDRIRFGDVTILVGDNGAGKSTLIEALAVMAELNAEGGSKNHLFSTRATHSELSQYLRPKWRVRPGWGWFLRAETFYAMASAFEDDPTVAKGLPALHEVSHGQSFLAVAEAKFGTPGFYVLDEPESALSIQGQMRLLWLIAQSVRGGSQFVLATHSPMMMAFPGARIFAVDQGIEEVAFEDVASLGLWRRFFADCSQFIERLLDAGDDVSDDGDS